MTDIAKFKEWLIEEQGLGDRTAHTYYKAIKSMAKRKSMLAPLREDRAASTKHLYWSALKQWAQFTGDDKLAAEVASPRIRRLATKTGAPAKAIEPYNDDEVELFRTALDSLKDAKGVDPWIWPSLSLMLALGLRAQVDLCRLAKESAVTGLRTGRLTIQTKRDKFRTLPAGLVEEELQCLVALPGWKYLYEVIVPEEGSVNREALAYRRVNRMIKQIAELCGLDPKEMRSHRFRHTAAMRLYEISGHDLRLVQQFLGHDNINTTAGYLRIDRTAEMGELLETVKYGKA